jgi:hypothetical protein
MLGHLHLVLGKEAGAIGDEEDGVGKVDVPFHGSG